MYKTLESHSIRLESDNTEASLLLSDLNDKISVQSILIEQLKVNVNLHRYGIFTYLLLSSYTLSSYTLI